jgi:molybdopterin-containing oxidoreductase family iron-sulfur binding subunit
LDYRSEHEASELNDAEKTYLDSLSEGRDQEVFAPADLPFEAPAKQFIEGPYYKDSSEILPELADHGPDETGEHGKLAVDRRDFMRLFSASSVFAATACVRRPVEKAIPYVNQPVDQAIGVPVYYATTCGECTAGCGIVVKTREGRPVKVEGNPENPISQGGSCAFGQATLQALYHPERRKAPRILKSASWLETDWTTWEAQLAKALQGKSRVGILTSGSTGHRHEFFRRFLSHIGSSEDNLYTFEPNTLISSTLAAHRIAFGNEMMPRPELRKAEIIVSIASDFLEYGISPVYNAKGFAESQTFKNGKMGRLIAFEAALSQTGGRAHERHVIPPGHEIAVAMLIARHLLANPESKGSASERAEVKSVIDANTAFMDQAYESVGMDRAAFDQLAAELIKTPSVVLCGSSYGFDENATVLQLVSIMINTLIGAYGETLFLNKGWMVAPVRSGDLARFMADASKLEALIVIDTDPVFNIPQSWGVSEMLKQIPLLVSMQVLPSDMDDMAHFVGNTHHYLESWGDEQPVAGFWSARQPTVRPAFGSKQAEDVLLWIAAAMQKPMGFADYREYLKQQWGRIHQSLAGQVEFNTFFDAVLRRGFSGKLDSQNVRAMSGIASAFQLAPPAKGGTVLISHIDYRLRDGRGAMLPILQEVGDSITSIAWDSFVAMNPKRAQKEGLKINDVIKVTSSAGTYEAAVFPLPGLHPDVVVTPRGNGHKPGVSKVTDGVGVNPLQVYEKRADKITGNPVTSVQPVSIQKTGARFMLAKQQRATDIGNRKDIIKEISFERATANISKSKDLDDVPDLYPALDKDVEYRWGMSIDLSACTGCSACMVACAVENNVPVAGREQIIKGREMHWIRLDRYFKGDVDNPELTIQPMLCQHCMHAPCEPVCPVYATTHDPEGINTMTYNRCVGTRYCANACPYKVRRFNWFSHKWNVIGDRQMDRNPRALNPDVTVRTRGVIEKCTFCIQRIKEAKYLAKEQDTKVTDGMLQTACSQACPTNAISFGDLKNPRSEVARLRKDNRAYLALNGDHEHKHYGLKTQPNVSYLAKVVHRADSAEGAGHGDSHHG